MDEEEGGEYLRQSADDRPAEKSGVGQRQRIEGQEPQASDEEQRKGKAEAETHEGRAGRAHHALQVLLRRRTQILQEGGGDGDGNPEFHGEHPGAEDARTARL